MKTIFIQISLIILINIPLSAQQDDLIFVKAGTKLLDYFPIPERYLYSEFIPGIIIKKSGASSERLVNYNFVAGEMEFIQNRDTLSFANKREIESIIVATDTFFYDKGYIEQLTSGKIKIGLKQYIELVEIQKKDPYGTASQGGASTSYGSLPSNGNYYSLTANKDMVFKKTMAYYFLTEEKGSVPINRKSTLNILPGKKDEIKKYLKANRVKYDSKEDILKLAEFIGKL